MSSSDQCFSARCLVFKSTGNPETMTIKIEQLKHLENKGSLQSGQEEILIRGRQLSETHALLLGWRRGNQLALDD